jgi:hypothetical protein
MVSSEYLCGKEKNKHGKTTIYKICFIKYKAWDENLMSLNYQVSRN